MAGLNKVLIIGNLGQDPEMRFTSNGTAFTTMSIAVNRAWTDGEGERHENTEWVRVVAWRRLAQIASEYLKKGAQVYVDGRLQTRQWEKNGERRYSTEVVATELLFLDKPPSRAGAAEATLRELHAKRLQGEPATIGAGDPDDLPFE